jgi:hypothetical protein
VGARWRRSTLVLSALAAIACGGLGAAAASGYTASVSVTSAPSAGPIDGGFLGLALEFNTIPRWLGHGSGPVNPVLVQLIRNLNPTGRPVIRIGGQSTDRSWWPVPGQPKPLGVTFELTHRWARSVRMFAQALNARLMLGVNLEANRPLLDRVEADHFIADIGRQYIGAIEVGNEPDLYDQIPWYHLLGGKVLPWYDDNVGQSIYARPSGYSAGAFLGDFTRALHAMPDLPIAGPETGQIPWMSTFASLLSPHSQLRMLTSHAYGVNNCVTTPSSPQFPSVPNLMSTSASRGLFGGLEGFVNLVHGDGGTYRIDEMGSDTCNGTPGVSNTMASALWVLDSLFALTQDRINGVNLHSYPNSDNGLFDFERTRGRWSASVHPIYYGALMFAEAAPPGSTLLQLSDSSGGDLRAWATSGPGAVVRVLLINDSLSGSAVTAIHAPAGFGGKVAPVVRLQASGAYATGGVSIGGRTFGARTTSGLLRLPVPDTATPSGGAYTVTVPAASAALLTLSHG